MQFAPGAVLKQSTAGKKGLIISGGSDRVSVINGSVEGPNTNAETALLALTETGIYADGSCSRVLIQDVDVSKFGYRGIYSLAARTRVIDCDVTGTEPTVQNSSSVGISCAGGEALIDGCRVSGYCISINAAVAINNTVVNNRAIRPVAAAALDIGIYCSAAYLNVAHNYSDGGIKVSYTADNSIISSNIVVGKSLWLTSCRGGNVHGNSLLGAQLAFGNDNSVGSGAARTQGCVGSGSTSRTTSFASRPMRTMHRAPIRPASRCRSGPSTAPSKTASSRTTSSSMPARAGCGSTTKPAAPCTNNTIRDNTFTKCGIVGSGDFAAIALGSSTFGGSTAEDISGTRVIGNRVISVPLVTSSGVVTTLGSLTVKLTNNDEMDKFRPGDLISGTGIPLGAIVGSIEALSLQPDGVSKAPSIVLGQADPTVAPLPATAGGTIVLTRTAMQVSYGLDCSLAKIGSAIEVWGNGLGDTRSFRIWPSTR